MKLKDLLFEVRIFQNNFIKVDMIKDELKMIFNNTDVPEISFDVDGMYIAMDNFKLREFDNYGGFKKFSISDAGLINHVKNIRKYYVEFIKPANINIVTEPTELNVK